MDRTPEIQSWCKQVGIEFKPEKIILFGSRASDTARDDSDVDLLIVMRLSKRERGARKAAAIRTQVHAPFPLDLIVHSPEEIQRRITAGDGFIKQVLGRGLILYEAKHE